MRSYHCNISHSKWLIIASSSEQTFLLYQLQQHHNCYLNWSLGLFVDCGMFLSRWCWMILQWNFWTLIYNCILRLWNLRQLFVSSTIVFVVVLSIESICNDIHSLISFNLLIFFVNLLILTLFFQYLVTTSFEIWSSDSFSFFNTWSK